MATTRPIAVILLLCAVACDRAESPPGSNASFPAPTAVFREVARSAQDLPLSAAAAILADDDGRVYVADSRALEIIVLDSSGTEIQRIGRRGDGPGEFRDLRSVGRLWTEVRTEAQSFAFLVTDHEGQREMFVPAPPRDDAVAPYVRGNRLYIVVSDEYDVPPIRVYELADMQRPEG